MVFLDWIENRQQGIFLACGREECFSLRQGYLLYTRHLILKSGASVSKCFLSGYTACETGTGIQSHRHAAVIS